MGNTAVKSVIVKLGSMHELVEVVKGENNIEGILKANIEKFLKGDAYKYKSEDDVEKYRYKVSLLTFDSKGRLLDKICHIIEVSGVDLKIAKNNPAVAVMSLYHSVCECVGQCFKEPLISTLHVIPYLFMKR